MDCTYPLGSARESALGCYYYLAYLDFIFLLFLFSDGLAL
jgi:hypothetical protein